MYLDNYLTNKLLEGYESPDMFADSGSEVL